MKQLRLQAKGQLNASLNKIIGHTISDKYRVAIHPKTNEIAYLSGSVISITNPTFTSMKYLFNNSGRSFCSLTYSHSGDYLAAGEASSKEPEILIYELQSKNEPIVRIKGYKSGIKAMVFSLNDEYLVTLGEQGDTRIMVWDWKAERRIDSKKLKCDLDSLTVSPNGYFITTGTQNVKFWSIEDSSNTGTKEFMHKNIDMGGRKDKTFVDSCSNADTTYIITESPANLCVVTHEHKMKKWMDLKATKGFTCKVDSKYLICGCSDGLIRLFDPTSLQHIITLPKPPPLGRANVPHPSKVDQKTYADVICILLDNASEHITAVYSDRTIIVWNIKELPKVFMSYSLIPHSAPVNDICMVGKEKFATCSNDRTLRFWDLSDVEASSNTSYCRDLYQILYTSTDYSHFKLRALEQSMTINQQGQMRCLKISPDGRFIACGDHNGNIEVYSMQTWSLIKHIPAHNGEVTCIDFVKDGFKMLMATGSRDRLIHIFDCAEFIKRKSVEGHNAAIVALGFAVDTNERDKNCRIKLVTCSADKWILFWNVSSEGIATKYKQELDKKSKPLCLAIDHNELYAVIGQEKKISVWKITSGKVKRNFELQVESGKHPITNISILVDPKFSIIVTSCSDKIIRIRDYKTGKCLLKISNAGYTSAVALTYDMTKLITASMEGYIMVWSLPEELIRRFQRKMNESEISKESDTSKVTKKKISRDSMLKEVEESSKVAMNAAAYVQNILLKVDSTTKEPSELGEKEEFGSPAIKNQKDELKLEELPESPQEPRAKKLNRSRRFSTIPNERTLIRAEEKSEELTLEEEGQPNEDIDILGEFFLKQRNPPEENTYSEINIDGRVSMSTMFWKEKLQIDEELKDAYKKAHKDPSKHNPIFPSQNMESLQGKLPNYKEAAANYNILELSKTKTEENQIEKEGPLAIVGKGIDVSASIRHPKLERPELFDEFTKLFDKFKNYITSKQINEKAGAKLIHSIKE